MTARTGMANVILDFRVMTEAGTADYAVAGVTYWTDDQLQDRLDRHRTDYVALPLTMIPREDTGGTLTYYDYFFGAGYWEEATSGTTVWQVQDSTGADPGTANYTVNYRAGHIRFANNTEGTAYYLTARKYDLNRAAADIWRTKAAHVASAVDWSSDNHSVKASQESARYLSMATFYENEAGTRIRIVERGDVW